MRARFGEGGVAQRGGGGAGGEHKELKQPSLDVWETSGKVAALGERREAAVTVYEAKSYGAGRDEGARTGVAPGGAESAGVPPLAQQQELVTQPEAQAAARAAAAPPTEMAQMEHEMEMLAYDEQPAGAAPRVAVAAEPHKRRAVAAGTAVGATVGVGGNGEDEDAWSTVLSRRARRQERARLGGTVSAATRKAAAARAAATWRKVAAVIEHVGKGE